MKRLLVTIVGLLALFSILRAHSQEATRSLVVQPSLIELESGEAGLSLGLGVVQTAGRRNQVWSVFPVRMVLRSGRERFAVSLSGLDLLGGRGVSLARPLTVAGLHEGDVVSVGGTVTVTGTVVGSVWVFGADAILGPGSRIDGDAVSLGGRIVAERGSVVTGNKQSLPALQIPFLGLITSRQSAASLQFVIELFGAALTILALFLALHFRRAYFGRQIEAVAEGWPANLLYLFLGVILVPILVAVLAVSVVGLLMIPALCVVLFITTYFGFLGVLVRLGRLFVKGDGQPARLLGSGLVGLAIVRGPALAGDVLTLLASDLLLAIGTFLKAIAGIALFLGLLYGFGCGLAAARSPSRQAAA